MTSTIDISLPFTRENAIKVLQFGRELDTSPYTHKQIAEWCDQYWCQYLDVDTDESLAALLRILTDVELQWDLYLANSYTFEELKTLDLDRVSMPEIWFSDWLAQLDEQ